MKNIVTKIISIPKSFYNDKNQKSFYHLLKETGYFEFYLDITEKDILNELEINVTDIEYWVNWSEDKRVSSGWCFQTENNGFKVVKLNSIESNHFFLDKVKACAVFIKKEIEDIRINGNGEN